MFKKAKFFLAGFVLCAISSYAQELKFAGTADKKFDGNKIVLYNRATGDHDSAVLKDGKFLFTVAFKEPTLYFFYSQLELKTKGGYAPYGIMVTEPGTIKIDADLENFTASKVSGSKENKLYKSFASKSSAAQQKIMDELYRKYGKDFVNNRKPDTSDARYKQLLQDYYKLSDAN
ncbi:MAG TPA: DUF4369 domain-containing protein, partial [Flavisolibacter sp.]|nr:DUF4369 domain-containing protein [Flavisolibacter sp.]